MGSRQKIFGCIGAILLSFGAVGTAWAADYYMSPSGNDSNPGTLSAPWRTLGKLHAMQGSLHAGDTIYFRDGEYVTGNNDRAYYSWNAKGTASAPITYTRYQNEHPVIVLDRTVLKLNTGTFIFLGDYVTVDGLDFKQTEASRSLNQEPSGEYIRRDPSGPSIGATALSTWATGVIIRNCNISNFILGVFYEGQGILVEKCTVTGTVSHGFYIAGANGTYRFNALDGSRGYPNQQGIQIQYPSSHGNRIYGNLIMNGRAAGVVFSGGNYDNQVFNNVIINGGSRADGKFGYALNFWCEEAPLGAGNKFYNNTIIGKSNSALINPNTNSACNGQVPGAQVQIYNNIFYPSSPVSVGLTTSNVSNNIFYNISGSVPSGNQLVDPKLANPMGTNPLDAMLTTGSPAIDKASATVNFDYQNGARPYGMGYDIGAFEFGSPANSGGPIVLPPGVGVGSGGGGGSGSGGWSGISNCAR